MKDLSKQFEKYQTAKHAKELEPRAKTLGISVQELAMQLVEKAQEDPKDFEKAMQWASVAIYEARREQSLTKE